ncbi:MAG: hypothetical protein EBU73_01665 [Chitinophagia bacterium]|jgi:hypothetical protein|nr:hypothetical protein [Chitinophagia bacterium]
MKSSKVNIQSFLLLVIVAAAYRAIPGRPWGFAPQFAMAIFSGAVVKDKKWALVFPVLSLLISDILYQLLYVAGVYNIPGFYNGMIGNYILFGSLTIIGFFTNAAKLSSIAKSSFTAPTAFFIISNFMVWMGNGGYHRPKTMTGLMQVYYDGLPFYANSILATVVFGALLFGANELIKKFAHSAATN